MIVPDASSPSTCEDKPASSDAILEPPPYCQGSSSTSNEKALPPNPGPPTDEFTMRARSNHVCIKETHNPVKGVWVIDPNVRMPPRLLVDLPEMEEGKERPNLYLRSEYSHVNAKLALISDEPTRSIIDISSGHGSIKVAIKQRINQRVALKIECMYNNVTVIIPRDFEGPLSAATKYGRICFSPAVQDQVAFYSRNNEIAKAFIGSLQNSGYSDIKNDNDWTGDEMELNSSHGNIVISFVDEAQSFEKDLNEAGPIAGAIRWLFRKAKGERTPTSGSPSTTSEGSPTLPG